MLRGIGYLLLLIGWAVATPTRATVAGPAASALAFTITIAGSNAITSSANDGDASSDFESINPQALPVSGATTANDGVSHSVTQYDLSISSFRFVFDHARDQTINSDAQSSVEISFRPSTNVDYVLSGRYDAVDASGRWIQLDLQLNDLSTGIDTVFFNYQTSTSTIDESFVLGQTGGDLENILIGSQRGTLIAGRDYILLAYLSIISRPSPAFESAQATGYLNLTFLPDPATCGDSLRDPREECDDGNQISGDGCSDTCLAEVCGNTRIDYAEQCDDGNSEPADGCSATCQLEICSNETLDPGEGCDDGNVISGDGCDANCTATACGNGIVTTSEQCDDGNAVSGDGCDPNCTATGCANNVLTPPEQCDDGNQISGDGCDINCTSSACGNGVAAHGEQCDDGDTVSGDGCDANCRPTGCGNEITTVGEECDDGNSVSGDGCDIDCSVSRCGNEIVGGDEECDDGNAASGDGCDNNCAFTGCGNLTVTTGEQCDDGNAIEDDGCDSSCRVNYGHQSPAQIKCIVNVNKGVAKVTRTQAKANERCLEQDPSGLDDCLEADSEGRVSRAKQDLQKLERNKCLVSEPPELALGPDRLSGSPAASARPIQLVRDLLSNPATAASKGDKKAAKCQSQAVKQANGLFGAIWDVIRDAKTDALEGRGTDAVVNDRQLSSYIEQMVANSGSIAKAADKLRSRVVNACQHVDTMLVIPGCEAGDASAVGACADRAARCHACQLLLEADPRIEMDCDALDDGVVNSSCRS